MRLGPALLLLVSACMVGPDYVAPVITTNAEWLERDDGVTVAERELDVAWWHEFEDPFLDDLVRRALDQNLSLRAAGVRVLQALALRGIAIGQMFPQSQAVNADYTRSKATESPANPQPYRSTWAASLDATWELDLWGKFRRAIEASDAELDASLAGYDDVLLSLVAEVALAYVDFRTLQERIRIAEANVKLQQEGLTLAEARSEAGATSELDPTQVRTLLAQTRALIPSLQVALRQTTYRLTFLLGENPRDLETELGRDGAIPTPPTRLAVGIPADLLRRRPDVRLAERLAAAQSARIGVAEADLYPSFFLSGSLGLQSNRASTLFESASTTGAITPGFSLPVFNYGRLLNSVRAQDAAFQVAVLDYRNAVLAAAQEVEGQLAAFLGLRERQALLEEAVAEAQRALELSKIQYAEGTADFQRVLDALGQVRQLQDGLTLTRGDVVASVIATRKALGGGWEVRHGRDLVPEEIRREMAERTRWGSMLDDVRAPDEPPRSP